MFQIQNDDHGGAILQALDRSHAIVEILPTGAVIRANTSYLRAVGYAERELIGGLHGRFVDRNSVGRPYSKFWDDLLSGRTQFGDYRHTHKDGGYIWFRGCYVPVASRVGKITKILMLATDITLDKQKRARKVPAHRPQPEELLQI